MTNQMKKLNKQQIELLAKMGYKIEDIEKSLKTGTLHKSSEDSGLSERSQRIAKHLGSYSGSSQADLSGEEKELLSQIEELKRQIREENDNIDKSMQSDRSRRIAGYLAKMNK